MAAVGRKKGAKGATDGPTPWALESGDREVVTHPETGMGLVTTDFEPIPPDRRTWERYSSYPHLTPEVKGRPEHVTSSRNFGPIEDPTGRRVLDIYARTHQDNRPGAPLQLDRFFAADRDTGEVFSATAKLREGIHHKRGAAPPTRGDAVASIDVGRLSFNVGERPDEKHPPLSPRSRGR